MAGAVLRPPRRGGEVVSETGVCCWVSAFCAWIGVSSGMSGIFFSPSSQSGLASTSSSLVR